MKGKVLLTTIPSDSHSWPLVFIQMFLEERGYEVKNLGTCVPFSLVAEECARDEPAVVVLSTVNGHGYMEGVELGQRLARLPNRSRFRLVAGGKLGTEKARDSEYAEELLRAGFDGVYSGPDALERFTDFLDQEAPTAASRKRQPV